MRKSACSPLALACGIAGIALGWVPVAGRFAALICGLLAVALGAVGMKRSDAGIAGSGHNLAVAGLALGCAAVFEGLRGFGCAALGGAAGSAVVALFS